MLVSDVSWVLDVFILVTLYFKIEILGVNGDDLRKIPTVH